MIRVIARPLCWLGWVVVLTTVSVDLYSQESMEQKKEAKRSIVDFARDIEPLFSRVGAMSAIEAQMAKVDLTLPTRTWS